MQTIFHVQESGILLIACFFFCGNSNTTHKACELLWQKRNIVDMTCFQCANVDFGVWSWTLPIIWISTPGKCLQEHRCERANCRHFYFKTQKPNELNTSNWNASSVSICLELNQHRLHHILTKHIQWFLTKWMHSFSFLFTKGMGHTTQQVWVQCTHDNFFFFCSESKKVQPKKPKNTHFSPTDQKRAIN